MRRVVETLGGREPLFRVETRRHGLRPKDGFPFAVVVLGRARLGDEEPHTSAGTHIRSTLIAPEGKQSTMQNFDASYAKFGVQKIPVDSA